MKAIINGITGEQAEWYPAVKGDKKAQQIRNAVLASQQNAWHQIFECKNISQNDLKEIWNAEHSE